MQNRFSTLSFAAKASLLLGLMLLSAVESRAGTITVTSTIDSTSGSTLRAAIAAANAAGGTWVITVTPGVYSLSLGELDVANNGLAYNITINGTAGSTVVKQTDGKNRVFNIDPNSSGNATVSLSGLTIEGGTDAADNFGGAGILDGSLSATPADVLNITSCIVSNNHCQALRDSSGNPGGGVSMLGGSLTVTGSTFANNSSGSSQGGGICFFPQDVNSILTVSGCTFANNSITDTTGAGVGGSAIYLSSTANNVSHSISSSLFTNNSVSGTLSGVPTYGTVQLDDSGSGNTLGITGCTFVSNSVTAITSTKALGAALAVNGGTVTVHYCRFFDNVSSDNSVLFSSVANSANVNATDNWWGCNAGPGNSGCGGITGDGTGGSFGSTVTFTPWMTLTISANPGTINVANSSTLTASFLTDSGNNTLAANNLGAFTGVPILFNDPSLGTLSGAQSAIQSSGTATVKFNAGHTPGTGHATAAVDNASVTGDINIVAGPATHFVVSLPSSATAGVAFNGTVTAQDQYNNTATGYSGTVHFTSTDGSATLPVNSTLTSGVGTFSFTLKTSGDQTVTATDTVTTSITGTSGNVAVSAGAATHFSVSLPSSATAGVAVDGTVTALDAFNNVATGYAGTVHFTSSDGLATLPFNSALASGSGTFSFTLKTVGNQTVTATDTVTTSITGTSGTVTVSGGAATHFTVTAPSSASAGIGFNVTVTALDQFNNLVTTYAGTVHFTSTDGQAVLPANTTLPSGMGTLSVTLKTSGNQTVTATDTGSSSITGTSGTIAVSAAAATHLAVSAPSSATAGVAFSGTVTAKDQFNNTATGYTGMVHFTSTDSGAGVILPPSLTLTAGVGTIIDGFTLVTAGNQTVTATDTVTTSITGTSGTITVNAGTATHLVVSLPSSATAGVPISGTVTAKDQFNNTATGYAGTVHFTSSDGAATLPADSTLTLGVGTFNFTLATSGNQTVTATDTTTSSTTGTSGSVTVSTGGATHFTVTAPSSASAGIGFNVTVTALDQFNNLVITYAGTVHFTSTDGQAVLPANTTLSSGMGTFSFTLKTSGNQTVTATDTTSSSISGTSGLVNVMATVTSPVVECPGTINTNSAVGACGQTVSFAATLASSTGPATITYTIAGSTVITSPYFFPVGTNEVTSTATNSVGTNVCIFSVVVTNSEPPVAGAFAMDPQENTPEAVPVAKILLVCESPRGGTLSIDSVTSPTAANGTVTLSGGLLTYAPAANYVGGDTINYVLSDGCGPVTGTVAVMVTSTNGPTQNGLTIQVSGNNAVLQFHGIPGTSYYIQQSTPSATGPWLDLPGTPVTADVLGLINYTAVNPPSPSYYRTSTQP